MYRGNLFHTGFLHIYMMFNYELCTMKSKESYKIKNILLAIIIDLNIRRRKTIPCGLKKKEVLLYLYSLRPFSLLPLDLICNSKDR